MSSTLSVQTGRDNNILREKSESILKITPEIKALIKKMEKTMKKEDGVGIAAPQVGKNYRIILCTIGSKIVVMINPVILSFSDQKNLDEEGCLSVPGEFGKVWRSDEITIEYTDEKNKKQKRHFKDFNARVVQHEVDHLNGILFVDRMKPEHLAEMNEAKTK